MSYVYGPMNKQARRTVAYFLKLVIEAGSLNSTMYAFGTMSEAAPLRTPSRGRTTALASGKTARPKRPILKSGAMMGGNPSIAGSEEAQR